MNALCRTSFILALFTSATARADIIRWDNNAIIPGTQSITAAPNVDLSNWSGGRHQLEFALFNADLSSANFQNSDLRNAKFATGASVAGANFTKANVRGTHFDNLTSNGFTAEQLYSTASYVSRNLTGITLVDDDLTGWDFSRQNLTSVDFSGATLSDANFANATISDARFDADVGLTLSQLYSTASYTKKNLRGVELVDLDLNGANLTKQNLSNATLQGSSFSAANLTKANLSNASISSDLSDASLASANLTRATFNGANLTNANFSGANVQGAGFMDSAGFTASELDSTSSYAHRNLKGIRLNGDDLTSWNFSRQNLTNASFASADLANANFANATITGADFDGATLTAAQLATTSNYLKHNLSNITLTDVDISGSNLTKQNLTRTSFTASDLSNSNLTKATLKNTNFIDTDLANATFTGAKFANANFSDADLRGATGYLPVRTTLARNTILPDGSIHGLALGSDEKLTIHNNSLPVTVNTAASFNAASTLEFMLIADWTSPIHFAAGITPALGGTLDLEFPADIDPASYNGDSFQLFDWNAPLASSDQFDALVTDPRFTFDVSQLYTDGIVTVTVSGNSSPGSPIPEPASLTLLTIGAAMLLKTRRTHTHS